MNKKILIILLIIPFYINAQSDFSIRYSSARYNITYINSFDYYYDDSDYREQSYTTKLNGITMEYSSSDKFGLSLSLSGYLPEKSQIIFSMFEEYDSKTQKSYPSELSNISSDFNYVIDFNLGVSSTINLDPCHLVFNAGVNLNFFKIEYESLYSPADSLESLSLGVAGQIGLKVPLTSTLKLNIFLSNSWDFIELYRKEMQYSNLIGYISAIMYSLQIGLSI